MRNRANKVPALPRFVSERAEADWWASAAGRTFLKQALAAGGVVATGGSRLVGDLVRTRSVQISLRLPAPDLAKARAIAERKGIGYQTLLKTILHEGLRREERRK